MCSSHSHSEDDQSKDASSEPLTGTQIEQAEAEPRGLAAKVGVGMVRGYQRYISRYTPPMCRFYPTCSQYTLIAIKRYGLLKGSWLGAWRIMRCHPFHPGGIDHVP